MFYEAKPNAGATLTFAARTRGGGGAAIGVLYTVRLASTAGAANDALTIDIDGASGHSVNIDMTDDGGISVRRYNTAAGSSRSTGTITPAATLYVWVDLPATMLTGTNATVYTFTDAATTAITVTGATSPAGTANDISGIATISIGAGTKGHWKIERVYVFQGADRPDTAAEARAIAFGDTAATAYTGLVFSAELTNDYSESVGSATGTSSGGMLDGPTCGGGLLNSTCTISRAKQDRGDYTGAPVTTYSDFASDVPCMVQDGASSESLENARQTGRTGFSVYFRCGQDVRNADRLTWDSRTLAVAGPPVSDPMRRHYTLVPCDEIKGGGAM